MCDLLRILDMKVMLKFSTFHTKKYTVQQGVLVNP